MTFEVKCLIFRDCVFKYMFIIVNSALIDSQIVKALVGALSAHIEVTIVGLY